MVYNGALLMFESIGRGETVTWGYTRKKMLPAFPPRSARESPVGWLLAPGLRGL